MTTLIYHSGALGDFVTALPAIARWHALHAHARRILLGRPSHGRLARDFGLFDDVWDLDAAQYAPLFCDTSTDTVRALLHGIDAAWLCADPDSPIVRNINLAGIPEVHAHAPIPRSGTPAAHYHLSHVPGALPADASTATTQGVLSAARTMPCATDVPPRTVALHPGSGSALKNWPLPRFVEVAQRLHEDGLGILWILGPAEDGTGLPDGARVCRSPDLTMLACTLARCALYVGNDSGVTHLAAAVGCPTVAIFGPSDAAVWTPHGARVRVVRSSTCEVACHLTKTHRAATCDRRCLTDVSVDKVVQVCRELLAG